MDDILNAKPDIAGFLSSRLFSILGLESESTEETREIGGYWFGIGADGVTLLVARSSADLEAASVMVSEELDAYSNAFPVESQAGLRAAVQSWSA